VIDDLSRLGRTPDSVTVSVRGLDGGSVDDLSWPHAEVEQLQRAAPWRTFRWHHGQRHYSGSYWSATTGDHVIYESRLELARLIYADFDRAVQWIVAQPFLLKALVSGQVRRHVPDFLLVTEGGPVVVDVKPLRRQDDPKAAFTLAWARVAVESRGWRFEVWSEPPETHLANLRFLAGYRRGWLFDKDLIEVLNRADLDGRTLREAQRAVTGWPVWSVRSALLHLVWAQVFTVDLDIVLSAGHVLRRAR
jgi:hypothetical protein